MAEEGCWQHVGSALAHGWSCGLIIFLSMLEHRRGSHGRSGGRERRAVVAVFIQMLYLAIQSSYGRSDSGFEHFSTGAARR